MAKQLLQLLDCAQRRRLLCCLALMLFGSLLETLGISLVAAFCGFLVDADRMQGSALVRCLGRLGALGAGAPQQAVLLALLLGLYLFKTCYLLWETWTVTRFVRGFRRDLSTVLYQRLLQSDYPCFARTDSASLIRLLTEDTNRSVDCLNAALQITTDGLVLVAVSAVLLRIDTAMTLVVLSGAGLFLLFSQLWSRRLAGRAGREQQRAGRERLRWLQQGVRGIKDIKAARQEGFFCRRYRAAAHRLADAEALAQFLSKAPGQCTETVLAGSVLLYVLYLVLTGRDVLRFLPSLSALVVAALRLLPACNRISAGLTRLHNARPALETTALALRRLPAGRRAPDADRQPVAFRQGIRVRGLTCSYAGRPGTVLRGVTMEIPAGSTVGIVGVSGGGKTTLLDLLLGLLPPQAGSICIDGVPLADCRQSYLQRVAYVPQTTFLLDDTVRGNVAMGQEARDVDDAAVWAALEKAALADRVRALPGGLDARVGEGGSRLSGGERQRLGLARAMYRDPAVLFLDEATSALDSAAEAAVLRALQAMKGRRTVVIVSHRRAAIAGCDRIYRVQNGTVMREK